MRKSSVFRIWLLRMLMKNPPFDKVPGDPVMSYTIALYLTIVKVLYNKLLICIGLRRPRDSMNIQSGMRSARYRIGAVAKLTGISPDALRVWERRYAVVTPARTSSGGRLYSDDDIARLRVMKQLVDAGDSIGIIAMLTHEELAARIDQVRPVTVRPFSEGPCRLMVVGQSLVEKMKAEEGALAEISLVASFASKQAFQSGLTDIAADELLIEQATLQVDTAIRLVDLITRVKASCAIVVYQFTA